MLVAANQPNHTEGHVQQMHSPEHKSIAGNRKLKFSRISPISGEVFFEFAADICFGVSDFKRSEIKCSTV